MDRPEHAAIGKSPCAGPPESLGLRRSDQAEALPQPVLQDIVIRADALPFGRPCGEPPDRSGRQQGRGREATISSLPSEQVPATLLP